MPTITEYLQQNSNLTVQILGSTWVQLVNNATGTAYVSTSASDASGKYTINNVPAGTYTVNIGSSNTGPWVATSDTNYIVANTVPMFNVMDYGAKGDGTTDDTAAINLAITAANNAGGPVIVPPGTYLIGTALTGIVKTVFMVYAATFTGAGASSVGPAIVYDNAGNLVAKSLTVLSTTGPYVRDLTVNIAPAAGRFAYANPIVLAPAKKTPVITTTHGANGSLLASSIASYVKVTAYTSGGSPQSQYFSYAQTIPAFSSVVPDGTFWYAAKDGTPMDIGGTQGNVVVAMTYVGLSIDLLTLNGDNGPGGGTSWRVTVDGITLPNRYWQGMASGASGGLFCVNLTWTSRDAHNIVFEIANQQFAGVRIEPTGALSAPVVPQLPKAVVICDSQGLPINSMSYLDNFGTYLGAIMDWNVFNCSQGGTGYVNPGTGLQTTFGNRIAAISPILTPDVVLFVGGQNDVAANGYSSTQRQAGVTSAVNAARAAWPNAWIVCVGPFYNTSSVPAFDVVRTDIMTALAAMSISGQPRGIPYIDTQTWVTGNGYSGGSTLPTATANLTSNAVSSFNITNAGAGLTQPPNVIIWPSDGTGYGATAHATISGGAVNAIIVDTGGSGYVGVPTVTLTNGAGTGSSSMVVSSDAVHFQSPFGQEYVARFIAQGILNAIPSPVGI